MNEEINIELQLQTELSRLKKAIEYIEQAERIAQQAQQLNENYQSKHNEVLKLNEELKSNINARISELERKLELIIEDFNKISNHVVIQSKTIQQYEITIQNIQSAISKFDNLIKRNEQEIERLKGLKWYQKLFGQK